MQNFYGIAIRQNTKTEMRRQSVEYFTSFEISFEETRHLYCPKDNDTWCRRQKDKMTGENKYKKKVFIPSAIKETLSPIFKDLSGPELLENSLHGQTQNVNDSLNRIIWKKYPKNLLVLR